MRSLPLAVMVSAVFVTVGSLSSKSGAESSPTGPATSMEPMAAANDAQCPEGYFPDDDVCVFFPEMDGELPPLEAEENFHRERTGRWAIYEQIPRRPERPASYDRYRYPIPPHAAGGHYVISGYDLDLSDDRQRRGRKLRAVGHGGVDLPAPRGTPIRLVRLDHEQGATEVLYVGHLFGNTVITKHSVREAGRLRDYIVLYGHLDREEVGMRAHKTLDEGDVIGFVGDSDSKDLVHLHLETRRVREDVDIWQTPPYRLLDVTVVCDPRNVLPLAN